MLDDTNSYLLLVLRPMIFVIQFSWFILYQIILNGFSSARCMSLVNRSVSELTYKETDKVPFSFFFSQRFICITFCFFVLIRLV